LFQRAPIVAVLVTAITRFSRLRAAAEAALHALCVGADTSAVAELLHGLALPQVLRRAHARTHSLRDTRTAIAARANASERRCRPKRTSASQCRVPRSAALALPVVCLATCCGELRLAAAVQPDTRTACLRALDVVPLSALSDGFAVRVPSPRSRRLPPLHPLRPRATLRHHPL